MSKEKARRYSPEVRERAVRLVLDCRRSVIADRHPLRRRSSEASGKSQDKRIGWLSLRLQSRRREAVAPKKPARIPPYTWGRRPFF